MVGQMKDSLHFSYNHANKTKESNEHGHDYTEKRSEELRYP